VREYYNDKSISGKFLHQNVSYLHNEKQCYHNSKYYYQNQLLNVKKLYDEHFVYSDGLLLINYYSILQDIVKLTLKGTSVKQITVYKEQHHFSH
jgi:hypothetical protein